MESADTPETGDGDEGAGRAALPFVRQAHHRLKKIGTALASIAAAGAILGGLAGYFNAWRAFETTFLSAGRRAPATAPVAAVSRAPTTSVLPFSNETGDAGQNALAEGLTQEVAAALANFDSVRLIDASVRSKATAPVSAKPEADYVVEGGLRKGVDSVRATIALTDARNGRLVWTKAFDLKPGADNYVAAIDESAGRIGALIGSWFGAIARAEYPGIRGKPLSDLTSYECIVQGIMALQDILDESYRRSRGCLESLTVTEPTNSSAWAGLAVVYNNQRYTGFGLSAEEAASMDKRSYLVEKTFSAASRSVALAPNDAFTHRMLAHGYALRCDRDRLSEETRKAIELNPNDPNNYVSPAPYIAYLGDWEAGTAMAQKAISIMGSDSPSRWWNTAWAAGIERDDYQQAYNAGIKAYSAPNWFSVLAMAATKSLLNQTEAAKSETATLLAIKPGFTAREADASYRAVCAGANYRRKIIDALVKAGLPE